MNTFLDALLPVFSLVVIGYIFKAYAFPSESFWEPAAKITYFAFFPALLVNRLATAQLAGVAIGELALAVIMPVLIVAGLLLILRPLLRVSNPGFTSVFQGSIRFNTYVGLAVVAALLGDEGIAVAGIALALLIPLVNLLSVAVLTHYVSGGAVRWQGVLLSVAKNPLILACLGGMLLNWSGIGLPYATGSILEIFSRTALPLGLLTVGAGLDLGGVRAATAPALVASVLKLLVLPLLALLVCALFHIDGLVATVALLFAALPTAPSAYILAQQLGGDVKLMAAIMTVQTALAAATMPLIALFL